MKSLILHPVRLPCGVFLFLTIFKLLGKFLKIFGSFKRIHGSTQFKIV